ncbi:glutathione S-transferase [Phyllosticta citricarpa]|uniref:glutathione transferase n=2 Tax=Phyllosticta TaxID=121621 RepID=A0ABR1M098_9PEZI
MGSTAPAFPAVKYGDISYNGKPILYVVKATNTSYINYMKVLMLAEELNLDYEISVVVTKDPWYQPIHPERYVPTIRDKDSETDQDIYVFESTACLQYLADIYDKEGLWHGKTSKEKGDIYSWTAYQTAGLGATSKYWLYFFKVHDEKLPKTIDKFYANVLKQWDILEKRLSLPDQTYIALKDRPTVADLAYLPFAMPYMFEFMKVKIEDWPKIKAWSDRMLSRPAVKKILEFAPTIGN